MKNISKFCLGLITVFSLSACGKGTSVSKEVFCEKAESIEETNNFTKAKLSYENTVERVSIKIKSECEGKYEKVITENGWRWNLVNDDIDYDMANFCSATINEYGLKRFIDNDLPLYSSSSTVDHFEEKFYIRPFGTNFSYKRSDSSYEYDTNEYYEWNDYGFLTKYTCISKTISKTENKNVTTKETKISVSY